MIITRIKASNVLKYEKLDLTLPEKGLIAISGQNESGKSSIGEAVCFDLFGRTFSIEPEDVKKVVRWGENHCAVTLFFKIDSQTYELARFLDTDGNHSAKLTRAGEEDPLARGVAPVGEKLVELLGFEYEQFVESFYLAQREITTPHPHSQAVKIMAGIEPLEGVVGELEREIEERNDLLEDMQAECDAVDQEIDELGIHPGHLQNLENDRLEAVDQADRVRVLHEEMGQRLDVYCKNTRAIYKASSARSRASFFRFVFFVLALLAGATWWLLTEGADLPQSAQLRDFLDQNLPQWQQVELIWIAYAAAGFGVLFLLMWMRVAGKASKVRRLRAESGELAATLSAAREVDVEYEVPPEEMQGESTDDSGTVEGDADVEDVAVDEFPVRPEISELEAIRDSVATGEATSRQTREYTEREMAWLAHVGELLIAESQQLDESITEEQGRLKEADNLHEIRLGMLDRRDEVASRVALRRKSMELLNGAIAHLSNNFNRDIKDLVARMLPLFTENRYEHLQIDDDLNVRVFSSEKRDFMSLEEVSSGTQRQIMLALRLALSQKLLSRTVKGKQFAFLDEPFAFFDEERTRNALTALANLGEDVSQVWIVAQTFPEDSAVQFKASVQCERGQSELVLA